MISERELWAGAGEVLRQHGDDVDLFVANRIGGIVKAICRLESHTVSWARRALQNSF